MFAFLPQNLPQPGYGPDHIDEYWMAMFDIGPKHDANFSSKSSVRSIGRFTTSKTIFLTEEVILKLGTGSA